jgi:hypothetical protein
MKKMVQGNWPMSISLDTIIFTKIEIKNFEKKIKSFLRQNGPVRFWVLFIKYFYLEIWLTVNRQLITFWQSEGLQLGKQYMKKLVILNMILVRTKARFRAARNSPTFCHKLQQNDKPSPAPAILANQSCIDNSPTFTSKSVAKMMTV